MIVATTNAGKLRELEALLAPLGITARAAPRLDVVESGTTFEENALIKARAAHRSTRGDSPLSREASSRHSPHARAQATSVHITGEAVLADDSGLCVLALDGAPGVRSARYATAEPGESQDQANRRQLLEVMSQTTERAARFVCVLAYIEANAHEHLFRGELEGTVGFDERGMNGFGYDSVLRLPDGRSFAELTTLEKNTLSHRARAVAALGAFLVTFQKAVAP